MAVAPEPTRTIDSGWQTSVAKFQKYEPQIIVVVVDAKRKLRLAPLKYALDISEPGDKLYLLGILHQVQTPSASPSKNSTQGSVIQHILRYKQSGEEQRKKEAEFERCLNNDPELQKLFASKQVKPEVQIAAGPDRKAVTARQAQELRAKWVILDKYLNSDKSYLMQKLNCNLVLMKPKNQMPVMIKPAGNSSGGYQATLDDKSIDYGHPDHQITNDVSPLRAHFESSEQEGSKSTNQNTIPAAASIVSSSSDSLQHLDSMKISSQAPDLEHLSDFDGQSARTELSSRSSSSQGEHIESQDVTAQFSDHDISSAKGTSLTWLRRGLVAADSDKDRQTESGPGISLELDKSYSESEEDDFVTRAVPKVGSVGSSSEDVLYKIPGRQASMSTGDLQSLMPTSSSAAPLYRPAPRSASYKGVDELMSILNPTPSTRASAGTARSVRTLQRSLQEEDLNLQSTDFPNSPIGRVNNFGSQDEDNRHLLDNSVHGRRNKPRPVAPSLCSHCKKPGPKFGCDAISFTYAELEEATNNFDQENYIAEGGYGFVYKGQRKGGQEIAVKQYKAASSQGDDEFYAEVEVLKHARHRNLVILIGYCIENERRLLVYEFVCNKSLDVHLSAKNVNVLEWKWRWKIAVGAARGLRYLHEECRVGCIVHRDMRPNNILLTHDYVPMLGDFGLARSQTSGDEAEETRVIGTLGYLAPEYAESGSITEKADVYSFGVVLLELITGRKAIDVTRLRETCLTEWARPMIQAGKTGDMVDPRLNNDYDVEQVNKMVDAAGRCISKDPAQRPKMSEVLRLLERDGDDSLSRGNSDIPRQESLNKLQAQITSGRRIQQEASLDGISTSKTSPKGNGASEHKGQLSSRSNNLQSAPNATRGTRRTTTSKSEKLDSRTSSPRPSLIMRLTSSNSPVGKAAHGSKPRRRLSYGDMLP